ncbi:galectin-4-like [Silurus meridionalis]|uniref:galectin-4-like n=1 Tax=Silurus meridionalis TaxID=175797 RepID=UPI001EEA66CD|nr:galectin-4-like [Silurus meridionalis]
MSCSVESKSFSIMEQSKITPSGSTYTNTLSIPSEVSNPIIQPTLPFMGTIPGGLKPDMAVLFQGAVPLKAKRFEINFHTGQSYDDGIAFHFNPCITAKYVCMNNLRNGKWENDECVYDKPFPKGTSFCLLIVIKSEGYEVWFNTKLD